jgi:long-chain acyl-CoA synthetase
MLHAMLRAIAERHPDNTAIVYGDMRLNYRQLYQMSLRLSGGLAGLGVEQADCVAIILPNGVEFAAGFFATAFRHAVALPIDPLQKKAEIQRSIRDCNARAIVTDIDHAEACRAIIADLNRPIELITVGGAFAGGRVFADLCAAGAGAPLAPYAGDVLYQYSSGSTGRPKRVCRTQANLFYEAANFTASAGVTSADAFLCMVPLFHAHGLGNCLLAAASSGAKLVILEQEVVDGLPVNALFAARCSRVLELIEQERVSILPGVPHTFGALAEARLDQPANLSSVRLCFSAGNFLPESTFTAFLDRFGIAVRELYGCTEAGSLALNLDLDVQATARSAGLPLRNVEIAIVDDTGVPLPAGQIGEIIFRSQGLAKGYCDMPQLDQLAFRNGYFYTGDLGRKDQQGRLYITGRKKVLIDTGGYKVDPLEIEDLLLAQPGVREAIVAGIEDPFGGEFIKAFVVADGACTAETLLARCRSELSDYKIPRVIALIDEIPKSPLGKVLRKELIQAHARHQAPRDSIRDVLGGETSRERRAALLEQHVRRHCREALDLPALDRAREPPFNELGRNSISAAELIGRLAATLDMALSVTLIWNYPTIAALAGYLADTIATPLRPAAAGGWRGAALADEAYAEIEQLSDQQARELLAIATGVALQETGEFAGQYAYE